MNQPLAFSNNVVPVNLPSASIQPSYPPIRILGWQDELHYSALDLLSFSIKIKKRAEAQINSIDQCIDNMGEISETHIRIEGETSQFPKIFCVNNPTPAITTCNVDSGSPILDLTSFGSPFLVGIAMANNRICNMNYPNLPVTTAINIRANELLDWIRQITGF